MASRTIISGYIAVPNGSEVRNEALIAAFPFDPVYALTNVFSRPRRGYAGSLLSFAAAIKAAPEEWPEWRERFEQLLGVRPRPVASRAEAEEAAVHVVAVHMY